MRKNSKILVNAIAAMDGTILQSFNRHDYKEYTCEIEGVEYFCSVDGGLDYLKYSGVFSPMAIYEDDEFSVIRRFLCRGGRGEEGDKPLTYTPLYKINDDWLDSLIEYEEAWRPDNRFLKYYKLEKQYRSDKV